MAHDFSVTQDAEPKVLGDFLVSPGLRKVVYSDGTRAFFPVEIAMDGESAGHPFRGNQYTKGKSGSATTGERASVTLNPSTGRPPSGASVEAIRMLNGQADALSRKALGSDKLEDHFSAFDKALEVSAIAQNRLKHNPNDPEMQSIFKNADDMVGLHAASIGFFGGRQAIKEGCDEFGVPHDTVKAPKNPFVGGASFKDLFGGDSSNSITVGGEK